MKSNLKDYIVLDGAEFAVTIDQDGEYVGDPLEPKVTEKVITGADCPCGDTAWTVERRGYCGEDVFIQCECGREYPLEHRIAAVAR